MSVAPVSLDVRAADAPVPDYVKDVAPLFTKYCAGCHNADDREGKLSLESFVDLQKGRINKPVGRRDVLEVLRQLGVV